MLKEGKNCGGCFILSPGTPEEERIWNTIVGDGARYMLRSLFSAEVLMPANFYLGVTDAPYTYDSAILADIAAGEPVGNGYARQAIPRDIPNWSYDRQNSADRARSTAVSFTASGTWTVEWTRMFLCNVASGTAGIVFALSGARSPSQVLSGQGPTLAWEMWLRP